MAVTLEGLLPMIHAIASDRGRPTSLAELAESAERSPTHFQRTFAKLVGESPKRYDTRLRLEAAAMLLECGDTTVLDIALGAGFESHEGFTRAFRSLMGVSPRDFRRIHAHLSPAALDRHASVVRHVGPCIGLYRMSTPDTSEDHS
ncbi:MAG: helix-turn-helix transcriptional regulator [Nannocystales bacterium]